MRSAFDTTRLPRRNIRAVCATKAQGDADGNGNVNGADLAEWRTDFGFTAIAVPAAGAVPEPSGLALALFGCMALVAIGRRSPSNGG